MENVEGSAQPRGPRSKALRLLVWIILAGVLVTFLLLFYASSPDPRCASLLALSDSEPTIQLPTNCALITDAPVDDMTKYLEIERKRRGLIFKAWVKCQPSKENQVPGLAFARDPHWIPSYVPLTYQFRRTIVIFPFARPIPEGSPITAEVCLMPRRKYISQIAGQCDGKFSVWK